jgi:alpha-tubulin suppressor-like RCC1 family protein
LYQDDEEPVLAVCVCVIRDEETKKLLTLGNIIKQVFHCAVNRKVKKRNHPEDWRERNFPKKKNKIKEELRYYST